MKQAVEIMVMLFMLLALIGVVWDRCLRPVKRKGIGVRQIQFVAVCAVVPTVLVLALEDRLSEGATASILGTVVGYALSSLGAKQGDGDAGQ